MTVIESVAYDAAAAERRAERIRLRLDAIADNYTAVLPMIRQAIEMRDDVALGYRSVGDYVADRFGAALDSLGVDVRLAVVRELAEAGLSSRAIAPVVGVTDRQVRRDKLAGGTRVPPAPAIDPETGEVGPDYPEPTPTAATSPAATEGAPGGRVERNHGATSAPAPLPPVIGRDGKTYTRPAPTTSGGSTLPAAPARPASPPKFGTRRRHAPQLDALVIAISGGVAAFEHVLTEADLDHTVTEEEAARLMGDLSEQIRSLNRIRNILKERTK